MSFATNQSQQISLFDATANLTDREKRLLEKSWAKYFAENIFPEIDEKPFSVLYSDRPSRHNTPVNVIIGALFRLLLLSRRGLHPDRFVHATLQAEPAYTPLRACNPTPRRLGAARVWSLVRIDMIFVQPDLPEHKLDSGKSLRVPWRRRTPTRLFRAIAPCMDG